MKACLLSPHDDLFLEILATIIFLSGNNRDIGVICSLLFLWRHDTILSWQYFYRQQLQGSITFIEHKTMVLLNKIRFQFRCLKWRRISYASPVIFYRDGIAFPKSSVCFSRYFQVFVTISCPLNAHYNWSCVR